MGDTYEGRFLACSTNLPRLRSRDTAESELKDNTLATLLDRNGGYAGQKKMLRYYLRRNRPATPRVNESQMAGIARQFIREQLKSMIPTSLAMQGTVAATAQWLEVWGFGVFKQIFANCYNTKGVTTSVTERSIKIEFRDEGSLLNAIQDPSGVFLQRSTNTPAPNNMPQPMRRITFQILHHSSSASYTAVRLNGIKFKSNNQRRTTNT